ncbi:MAG TPA: alpha/beta fold hydrolase [Pseudobdellovibrionaceae bacterium]|jgi:dipeptidyl aminopeptidase/acylaminoacyl peptidase
MLKREVHFLDEEFQKHYKNIQNKLQTEFKITSLSLSLEHWVIMTDEAHKPAAFYFFNTKTQTLSAPLHTRKSLLPHTAKLQPMECLEILSRDGFPLVSYLTRAKEQAGKALILLVHGGPWSRDRYGFNVYHQWLADRGYNVLSVNFRSSVGFGKNFLNAGDQQWGHKMHEDLLDAVNWAVNKGHADSSQVVIMGASYGGYAALAGLTFTPDTFAAAVDIVGPSNLETLLSTIPPYWESFKANLYRRVGDPTTEAGQKLLKKCSPLTHVDKIKKPLLILQGANDPRVKKAEADQIFNSMLSKKIPVQYILFPDEGHGFAKSQNNMGANAIIEGFLQKFLGGRLEDIEDDLKESSAQFITALQ